MIRKKLLNFPLETASNEGNPKSHYWPKKSEQDAVRGDFFGDYKILHVSSEKERNKIINIIKYKARNVMPHVWGFCTKFS